MVQVLEENPTFGAAFGRAIGTGLGKGASEGFSEAIRKKQNKAQLDKEDKDILSATGIDLRGIINPELRKATLAEKLRGQTEETKQQAKYKNQLQLMTKLGLDLDEEDQGFGDQILPKEGFGKTPAQAAKQGFGLQEQPSESSEEPEERIQKPSVGKLIPDKRIQAMALVNPAVADKMQKHNDQIREQQRHEQTISQRNKELLTKEVTASYAENKPFIDKTYDQYEDSLRKDAIIDRLNQLDDSEEMSDSGVINFLESLGLAPEWLKNPANEEYNKLALDLLGGGTLQADYGSRLFASEFKVSQQRIPSLSQTKEGRRQIAENIRTLLLPARLKHERMQYYLDKAEREGKPLPHDLRGKILKDIKPQLEEAYDKFKQRNGRYKVRIGTVPDDNAIEKYYFISNGDEKKAFKMMLEDGYELNEFE